MIAVYEVNHNPGSDLARDIPPLKPGKPGLISWEYIIIFIHFLFY